MNIRSYEEVEQYWNKLKTDGVNGKEEEFIQKYLNKNGDTPRSYIELQSLRYAFDPSKISLGFGKNFYSEIILDCIENPILAFLIVMDLLDERKRYNYFCIYRDHSGHVYASNFHKGTEFRRPQRIDYEKVNEDYAHNQISKLVFSALNHTTIKNYFLKHINQYEQLLDLMNAEDKEIYHKGYPDIDRSSKEGVSFEDSAAIVSALLLYTPDLIFFKKIDQVRDGHDVSPAKKSSLS